MSEEEATLRRAINHIGSMGVGSRVNWEIILPALFLVIESELKRIKE